MRMGNRSGPAALCVLAISAAAAVSAVSTRASAQPAAPPAAAGSQPITETQAQPRTPPPPPPIQYPAAAPAHAGYPPLSGQPWGAPSPYATYPPPYVVPAPVDEDRPTPGMRNAGIVLTITGLTIGGAGAALLAFGDNSGGNYTQAFMGLALCPLGGAMLLTGIPLWAVGAARLGGTGNGDQQAASMAVSLGAGSAALQGSF